MRSSAVLLDSVVANVTTRDGRKRAPRHLFGNNHIKPFPWFRVIIGVGIMGTVVYGYYRRSTYMSPREQFIRKITVRPYGVMGTSMTLQGTLRREAADPDSTIVITDPSDLMVLYTGAKKATGTSGAIYKWLGLKNSFPDEVVLAVSKPCDAKHHMYGEDKHVIHVVGPDFGEGIWSEREASIELSRAYRNVLHEFAISDCATLRMVPISSGDKAGPLHDQLPPITHEALLMAFEQLHIFDKEYVLRADKKIDLCVFVNRDYDMFHTAFKNLKPTYKFV